ncbi:deoxyribose-phosphate aldolase [Enteractinococcus coprophilus]|uniref:Deoxyribose-phosphate aldolase n=1 Tax=Enteractinococcus coprophilus TaxID=1027633 RepID=A0A543AF89_9MICC|nr:deoxyribose-phosphate aldolase [Enteractinococcus coprophilus]
MSNTAPLSPTQVDQLDAQQLASMIDHTLLAPTATVQDIDQLCDQAAEFMTASVCIQPIWVAYAAKRLDESPVKICTVIGFPSGAQTPETKAFETAQAITNGAEEVDMVINQAAALVADKAALLHDIRSVVDAAAGHDVLVKVILETAALTDQAKILACEAALEAGADFVKTSTGFGPGGATAADVTLLRNTVGHGLGVKASGGIRTRQDAMEMLKAGATRLGASSTYAILS